MKKLYEEPIVEAIDFTAENIMVGGDPGTGSNEFGEGPNI